MALRGPCAERDDSRPTEVFANALGRFRDRLKRASFFLRRLIGSKAPLKKHRLEQLLCERRQPER